ncbi:oxidoreductase [Lactobacillus delbrueckii]|nr:oxidoreductase [Lactobacillus delbrueckii]
MAGFGTAVAIPASILMTFGINPIEASVICLVANTTPTAFGAVGLPVITLAQTAGADGVYVTNHGGREIDGAPATIDVLPEVVEAVNGRCPVIFDGGVRRGSHVFKALALGADLVGIGRPYLYGLALGGPHGVASVINELNDELKIDMQLTGCKTIEDVKHARLTDFQYAGDTKPSSTDPRVCKPYPVTAVNQIKSEPDAATGASHH